MLTMVDAIADHMGLEVEKIRRWMNSKSDVSPEIVIQEMEQKKHEKGGPRKPAALKK